MAPQRPSKFTLGRFAANHPATTATMQIRISPVGSPTHRASTTACAYNSTAKAYNCAVPVPKLAGAYLVQAFEKVAPGVWAPAQNASAVPTAMANPETITVN